MGRKIEVLFHFEIMFNELVCSKLPCVSLKLTGPCLDVLIFKSLFEFVSECMWVD